MALPNLSQFASDGETDLVFTSFGGAGDTGALAQLFVDREKSETARYTVRKSIVSPFENGDKFTITKTLYDPTRNVSLYPLEMQTKLPNGMGAKITAICSDGCIFNGASEQVAFLDATKNLLRKGYTVFGDYAAELKSSELSPNHIDSFTATIFANNDGEEIAVATLSADIIPISRSQRQINGDQRITGLDLIKNAREGIYRFSQSVGMSDLQYVIELNSLVLINPETMELGAGRYLGTDYTLGLSRMIMDWARTRLSSQDLERTCVIAVMNENTGNRFRIAFQVPYHKMMILNKEEVLLRGEDDYFQYYDQTSKYWVDSDNYTHDSNPVVALFGNSFKSYTEAILNWELQYES